MSMSCSRPTPGSQPARRLGPTTLAVVALCAFCVPGSALGQEFQVDLGERRSVRFISRTSLEEFEGVSDRIDGYVSVPDGVQEGGPFLDYRLDFEVDLAALDSGIGLRNRHMRDNYLETATFPFATFAAQVNRIESGGEAGMLVTAVGVLSIHGVERDATIRCGLDGNPTAGYRVRCRFPVRLADHGIEVPRVMFMKLADEVVVDVDFLVREP